MYFDKTTTLELLTVSYNWKMSENEFILIPEIQKYWQFLFHGIGTPMARAMSYQIFRVIFCITASARV